MSKGVNIRLDLSKVSGGNKNNVLEKTNKRIKRISVTIGKRNLKNNFKTFIYI